MIRELIQSLPSDLPVLIAGPTASGKSALALAIAEAQGGVIVNADASQVYSCWRVLTARPSPEDEARVPHALYGHVSFDTMFSTGQWLRDVSPILSGDRPIIVGGTGLNFRSLTEGLVDIPSIPATVRMKADSLSLENLVLGLDEESMSQIDLSNRVRVQRAWEVLNATGTGLAKWQKKTSPSLMPTGTFSGIVMESPKDWLTPRIRKRFSTMLQTGGLDEAEAMQDRYDPALPSCRAIGVKEAMSVLSGDVSMEAAIDAGTIATRQYAKRQRTWFRSRMANWCNLYAPDFKSI